MNVHPTSQQSIAAKMDNILESLTEMHRLLHGTSCMNSYPCKHLAAIDAACEVSQASSALVAQRDELRAACERAKCELSLLLTTTDMRESIRTLRGAGLVIGLDVASDALSAAIAHAKAGGK